MSTILRLTQLAAVLISLPLHPSALALGGGQWYGDWSKGSSGNGEWTEDWQWELGLPTINDVATFSIAKSYTVTVGEYSGGLGWAKVVYITAGNPTFDLKASNLATREIRVNGSPGAASGPTLKVTNGTASGAGGYGDEYIGTDGAVGSLDIASGTGIGGFGPGFYVGTGTAIISGNTYAGRGHVWIHGGVKKGIDWAFVGVDGGSGSMTIDGTGTVVRSNWFQIGSRAGEGTLVVTNGAVARVYENSGSGSTLGMTGKGFLQVSNGGSFSVSAFQLASETSSSQLCSAVLDIQSGAAMDCGDILHIYDSTDTRVEVTNGILKSRSINFAGDVSRLHFNSGTLWLNGGSMSNMGSGSLQVNGLLMGNGTINGNVLSRNQIAPGTSPGTLTINGDLTLTDGASFGFDLGTTSDRLNISGQLIDAGSGPYTFNFADAGGFASGTYTLLTFASTSGISVSDFAFTSSIADLQGAFLLTGNTLQFTTLVPEPVSLGYLASVGLLATRRRR